MSAHVPQDMEAWIQWAVGQTDPGVDQHVCSATTGEPGTGKSGFNQCLAVDISEASGLRFDYLRQIAMKPKYRRPLAMDAPKRAVIITDESTGEGGHRRRAMSKENVANVQDLDAMRGRNQVSLETAPSFVSLDTPIQEATMWIFDLKKDKSGKAYERIKTGKPGFELWHTTYRFSIEAPFPHSAIHFPEVWAGYLRDLKLPSLQGRDVALEVARLDRVRERAQLIRRDLALGG